MINFKITADGGVYKVTPEKRVLGVRYTEVAISVEKPYDERESVCVMAVLHYDIIADLVLIGNAPVTLKSNITQYKNVAIKFNFIRPDGTVKSTEMRKLFLSPADLPDGFTPATPYMNSLASDIEYNFNVNAALSNYVLTLTTLNALPLASVDYKNYITELAELFGDVEREDEIGTEIAAAVTAAKGVSGTIVIAAADWDNHACVKTVDALGEYDAITLSPATTTDRTRANSAELFVTADGDELTFTCGETVPSDSITLNYFITRGTGSAQNDDQNDEETEG